MLQSARVVPQRPRHKINRGDRMGNVVATYKDGNTTIIICDDYAAKTSEEIERVLDDNAAATWAIWNNLSYEEQQEIIKELESEKRKGA